MRRLDCCNGIEYHVSHHSRERVVRHDLTCPQNPDNWLDLLAEEGIGMAGRELREESNTMRAAMDTETGGLDAQENPLLQLTIYNPELPLFDVRVKGLSALPVGVLVNPATGKPYTIHPRAIQANGLNPTEGLSPEDAAEELKKWWLDCGKPHLYLIGHNVGPFDVPFAKQLTRVGVDLPWAMMFDYHYLDTATLAFAMQEAGILHFGKWSLANVCQVLGILYDPHLAKADAKAAWHAWHRMEAVLRRLKELASYEGKVDLTAEIRAMLPALDLRG